jgi:hypothetical protein
MGYPTWKFQRRSFAKLTRSRGDHMDASTYTAQTALLCVPHANAMETPALGKPVLTLC